jgi:hypothetical protein
MALLKSLCRESLKPARISTFAALLLIASSAWGQALTRFEGAVLDPSGAVVVDATATLSSSNGSGEQSCVTGSDGSYSFASVVPG